MIYVETTRLFIEDFKEEYINSFMEYRNDLEQMKYQGFKGLTKDEYKKILLKKTNISLGIQVAIILKETNTLIGDLYLKKYGTNITLGYAINKKYYRNGYATEACTALINYLPNLSISTITAEVDSLNIPSRKFLEKIDFYFEKEENDICYYTVNLKKPR